MSSAAASAAETCPADSAFFSVHARAEPGTMPRVLEIFAKRGFVPSLCRAAVSGADRERLAIEIEIAGLDDDAAEYIARCLRQIVSVDAVLKVYREPHR